MAKVLERPLPNMTPEYNQAQMNQLVRQLEQALMRDFESTNEAEEREAMQFFLAE